METRQKPISLGRQLINLRNERSFYRLFLHKLANTEIRNISDPELSALAVGYIKEAKELLGIFADLNLKPTSNKVQHDCASDPDAIAELKKEDQMKLKSKAVMEFVESFLNAYLSGFTSRNHLNIAELYQCARHHVKHNYNKDTPNIIEKFGEKNAFDCGLEIKPSIGESVH